MVLHDHREPPHLRRPQRFPARVLGKLFHTTGIRIRSHGASVEAPCLAVAGWGKVPSRVAQGTCVVTAMMSRSIRAIPR
ncbi:hypothetical protein GCM10011512_08720 [Tersicoccus solisilvae]|uniref:Uncharacterized protein n=1 Tax=Tersicoccus solisilvae TaxID=1882339 RepID=A0ABQ1NSZ7_9MICC|nr:hypothetical protein GCM10011512_08720 [Tersicoccus solisilvae]